MTKNRETHGRTVKVGRSAIPFLFQATRRSNKLASEKRASEARSTPGVGKEVGERWRGCE